jgi:class 3 adenylate cyclase
MAEPPSGTVTFLFTDIESSTALWERHPEAMKAVLARHDRILGEVITIRRGHLFKALGDGVCAAFATASDALAAAVDAQRTLRAPSRGPRSASYRSGSPCTRASPRHALATTSVQP